MPAAERYRTHDGTCNNSRRPRWGAAQMPFNRFLPPEYGDGVDTIRNSVEGGALSSSRFVSLLVHGAKDGEAPLTLMIAQWGQLLDHDLTSTAQPRSINGSVPSCCGGNDFHPSCYPIKVPLDDPWLSPLKVRCLEFLRSAPAQRRDCVLSWREQTNQATSYIDASPIYSNSAKSADNARIFRNGLLVYGRGSPAEDICQRGGFAKQCIRAGDGRSGEQPGLLALHHVWVGEHNRIALELSEINPHWSDEKIYQETRRIIGAMFQHITYREFLPIVLGREVCKLFDLDLLTSGYYEGYDLKTNPTVANSFAAAAFRFGHSLVQNSYMRCDRHHNVINNNVSLHEEFQRGDIGSAGSLNRLIRGMANQRSLKRDEFITPELTNHLFQTPGFPFGLDLAAINIQRGRDHGIAPYTSWRIPCGLTAITSWDDFANVVGPESARRIGHAYRNVHDIDLFVGGIAERPVVGGLVGPTFACIIAQQFSNSRKGDRFWYENGGFESSFTPAQLHSIRRVSLAQVLCRVVGGGTFQPHIFIPPEISGNERVICGTGSLTPIDLGPWLEQDPFNVEPVQHTFDSHTPEQIFNILPTELTDSSHTSIHIFKENKAGFPSRDKPSDSANVNFIHTTNTENLLTTNDPQRLKDKTKVSDKLDIKRKHQSSNRPTQKPITGVNNKLDKGTKITLNIKNVNRRPILTTTKRTVIVNNVAIELRNADEKSTKKTESITRTTLTARSEETELSKKTEGATRTTLTARSEEETELSTPKNEIEARTENENDINVKTVDEQNDKDTISLKTEKEHRNGPNFDFLNGLHDDVSITVTEKETKHASEDEPTMKTVEEKHNANLTLLNTEKETKNENRPNFEQVDRLHNNISTAMSKKTTRTENQNDSETRTIEEQHTKEPRNKNGPNFEVIDDLHNDKSTTKIDRETRNEKDDDFTMKILEKQHKETLVRLKTDKESVNENEHDFEILDKLHNDISKHKKSKQDSNGVNQTQINSKLGSIVDQLNGNILTLNVDSKVILNNSEPYLEKPTVLNVFNRGELMNETTKQTSGVKDAFIRTISTLNHIDIDTETLTDKNLETTQDSKIFNKEEITNNTDVELDPFQHASTKEHKRVQRKLDNKQTSLNNREPLITRKKLLHRYKYNLTTTTTAPVRIKITNTTVIKNVTTPRTSTLRTTTTKPTTLSSIITTTTNTYEQNSELRQYDTRSVYSSPQKVVVGGTNADQYEIEINIRQTNKSPLSAQLANYADYTTANRPYNYDRYTLPYIDRTSTTPTYAYYQPLPTTPPYSNHKRTKPPTIIYLDEHDERLTTKAPGLIQNFLTFASNSFSGNRNPQTQSTGQKDRPSFELSNSNSHVGSVHSSNVPTSHYVSQPPIPPQHPVMHSSFSQISSYPSQIHTSGTIAANNFGSITGVATSSGGDSIFSFNIRPKPVGNRPVLGAVRPESGSYGLVSAHQTPYVQPEYVNLPVGTPQTNSFYEQSHRENINSPFSTSLQKPQQTQNQPLYLRNQNIINQKEASAEQKQNDFDYLSRTLEPLTNLSTTVDDEYTYYDDDNEAVIAPGRVFDRDGYLRPEHMVGTLLQTKQNANSNETTNNSPNKLDDDYVLPVLNGSDKKMNDIPKPMQRTTLLIPIHLTETATNYPDTFGKHLNNDILAEDIEETSTETLLETKTAAITALRHETEHRLNRPALRIAFAPIKILTKPERPDNWVIYDTPEEKPLLPAIPEINVDASPTAEVPMPINIEANSWIIKHKNRLTSQQTLQSHTSPQKEFSTLPNSAFDLSVGSKTNIEELFNQTAGAIHNTIRIPGFREKRTTVPSSTSSHNIGSTKSSLKT
ncbi:uncharacterized protein LOC119683009 [Teleopsis dalmanni]|uniref:uncharacterized protein LOC119683009 n=1 Tax=Teleopsis dalmanni TaxID=139649 RepID=UPI0018CF9BD0|nr:uncharacterized protein LOC119683009 [Teleopsis dalmanni]